jgi:glycosyltransferase involved in cell wall biosynthesis
MRIGINGRFLTKPYTGIGQYTKNLFTEMANSYPNDEFFVITPEKVTFQGTKNFHIVVIPEKKIGTGGMKKTYWEQVQVIKAFNDLDIDLVHFPYPSNPWKKFNKPVVVTVHDAIPWTLKEYNKSFLTKIYQSRAKKSLKYADKILTVSNYSKKEILSCVELLDNKLEVVYNAAGATFFQKVNHAERTAILSKYGLGNKPFLLYVGGYDERKNVRMLIDIFVEEIASNYDVDLVLAGGKSVKSGLYSSIDYLTLVNKRSSLALHRGHIVTIGFVDEADLPALYQSCFAFISLSGNEGFNLPLIEASVSGAVVIASNIPVHKEVAKETAIFVDDKKDAASMLKSLLEKPKDYHLQKQKILGYKCPFSWKKSAEKVHEIYKKML